MGALPNKKLTRARKGRRLSSPAYRLRRMHPARCPRCRAAKRPPRRLPGMRLLPRTDGSGVKCADRRRQYQATPARSNQSKPVLPYLTLSYPAACRKSDPTAQPGVRV